MRFFLAIFLIIFSAFVYADTKIPALDDIPSILADADKIKFDQQKQTLKGDLVEFQTAGSVFNAKTAEEQTDEEFNTLGAQRANYISAVIAFNQSLLDARFDRIVETMLAAVQNAPWESEEKERAEKALKSLDIDGDAATSADIQNIWKAVQARRGQEVLASEAAQGQGPGLPGAGNQTIHKDCVIFALANAAGVPYGVAAARAAEFIRDGQWRPESERMNPQQAIEDHGLMGGEVILVAEAFGQAAIVPSWEFESTLQAGRPVMVNLVPYSGAMRSGHEVVLTKTFKHAGETWFEMIDSNEKDSEQRLYLNEKELGMMLKENGVSFQPETDRTAKLLRKADDE